MLQAILVDGGHLREQENVKEAFFSIPRCVLCGINVLISMRILIVLFYRFLGYYSTHSIRDFDRFSSSVVQIGVMFTNSLGRSASYNSSGIVIGEDLILTTAHTFLTPEEPNFQTGCQMEYVLSYLMFLKPC